MPFQEVRVRDLRVNRANDRHGELENETAAIGQLFRMHETQMRNLAADIAREQRIYDPPLVLPDDGVFIVYDGNRRVTCLKLIVEPHRAPTQDLQQYFQELHDGWTGGLPTTVECQVEEDRDAIDAILYRRHTGSQRGVGQLTWNDRAKSNFVERTGRDTRFNLPAAIEAFLTEEERLPEQPIPWSTLRRLLSSEDFRNRVGISVSRNELRFTHERDAVADALARIAADLASQRITLGHLWNNEGKRAYLNSLEEEGVLPTEAERLIAPERPGPRRRRRGQRRPRARRQLTFVPEDTPHIQWTGAQQRVRSIWEELQTLRLATYPNAISALLRMLVELAVDGYIAEHHLQHRDTLSRKVGVVLASLLQRELIDQQYHDELDRIRRDDQLISVASMQRYLHSPDFAPMENELRTYWMRFGRFLVACLAR
jgi:hypothetical protein